MQHTMKAWLLLLILLSTNAATALSAEPLTVVTRDVPPFAIKQDDGSWAGLSIDLWRHIATRLGVETRFVEADLKNMLDQVATKKSDVAVAALTITRDRELRMDFTHPFLSSGLGIAVNKTGSSGWATIMQRLFSSEFVRVLSGLLGLLLVVGIAIWLFERRRNNQFDASPARGIGAGLWWSAVTMTTVGYGDKAPQTFGGRIVAIIWMFASVIIISSFTAAIATALTIGQLGTSIRGENDLGSVRVATVANSTSADYLHGKHVRFRTVADVDQALQLLLDKEIDAVVYDAPILRYRVLQQFEGTLAVLAETFNRQDYGFALAEGSKLREPVNRELLEYLKSVSWQGTMLEYLGRR